ncbi:MAG: hypothetical protein ACLUNZ_10540 [Evtepia sp.]
MVTASLSALTCIFILNQKLAILFCVLLLIAIFLFKYKKIQKLQEEQRFLILAAVLIVLSISACGVLTKAAVSAHNNIPASTSETKGNLRSGKSPPKDVAQGCQALLPRKSLTPPPLHMREIELKHYPDTPASGESQGNSGKKQAVVCPGAEKN